MANDKFSNKTINEIAEKYKNEVFTLNDSLADFPEVSGVEFESAKKIVSVLTRNGIKTEHPFFELETSFKATINENKEKKAAILVEYDALPGIGHGCGHCASGSISVLAGLILNELRDKIDARIDIIGTPDEEFQGCKAYMADKGIFDEYDFAIMIHMSNKVNGVYQKLLALDAMEFEFIGKPAHAAASPWDGQNALNAVRLLFDAVDMLRQHVTPDVRIHGYIKDGGKASNIVPDYTSAEFLARADKREYLNDITEWVKDCARAAALATRTELKINPVGAPFDDLSSYETAEALLKNIFETLDLAVTDLSREGGGSSDIGNVDHVCPAFQPFLGIHVPYALHTKEFAEAMKSEDTHEAIRKGGAIISSFIMHVYNDDKILEGIKADYKKKNQSQK